MLIARDCFLHPTLLHLIPCEWTCLDPSSLHLIPCRFPSTLDPPSLHLLPRGCTSLSPRPAITTPYTSWMYFPLPSTHNRYTLYIMDILLSLRLTSLHFIPCDTDVFPPLLDPTLVHLVLYYLSVLASVSLVYTLTLRTLVLECISPDLDGCSVPALYTHTHIYHYYSPVKYHDYVLRNTSVLSMDKQKLQKV